MDTYRRLAVVVWTLIGGLSIKPWTLIGGLMDTMDTYRHLQNCNAADNVLATFKELKKLPFVFQCQSGSFL